jgi:hypothetical protein
MRNILVMLAFTLTPLSLHAQTSLPQQLPGVVTAAPMPTGPNPVNSTDDADAPAYRAGGALDAGPLNATPFSASGSISLTSTLAGRELNASRPGGNFMPSIGAE